MGLGKTFTNSIVREVGRNYGKAISNSLLGDKHSTPHRIVGNNTVDRKRGRIYHNDLDKAIQKFEIKGHQATFNQALNIHSEYFQLVDEANSDGSIDLNEIVFLVKSSRLLTLVVYNSYRFSSWAYPAGCVLFYFIAIGTSPAQRSQLTSRSEILRSVQKLTVLTVNRIFSLIINQLLVFK